MDQMLQIILQTCGMVMSVHTLSFNFQKELSQYKTNSLRYKQFNADIVIAKCMYEDVMKKE